MAVAERTVRIENKNGIHARPAAELVKVAARFPCDILVGKEGNWVNGKSIMGVMTLAAERGSNVTVRADGEQAAAAVEALAEVLKKVWTDEE